jgi:hypothetical protein
VTVEDASAGSDDEACHGREFGAKAGCLSNQNRREVKSFTIFA